ncbi:MAG: hypothetical protein PHU49_16355 [Syntrophorhabdaceae bacterium]|nr:hypothetical protein [Syntrophorhabdaceae bacterium]
MDSDFRTGAGEPAQPAPAPAPEPAENPLATPVANPNLVTVPGVAPPETAQQQQERMLEFKARGEMQRLPESEVLDYASKGFDYTQKTQELAPYREMRDFIENTPGAADAIISLMNQGVPQQQAQQTVQQQMAPAGYQQAPDPGVNFLLDQVAGIQAQMEAQQFQGKYPQADFQKVVQHLADHPEIPTLELAYRDMSYDDVARQAGLTQQQQQAQRQQMAVEPGAQGPPESYQVDPLKLSPGQVSEVAKRYRLIE